MYASFASLLSLLAFCHLAVASLSFEDAIPLDEHYNQTLFRRVRTGGAGLPAVQTVQSIFTIGDSGNPSVCK
jgi:acyl CoA:acetate/3-ketoacid CoA transferase alpha subunit